MSSKPPFEVVVERHGRTVLRVCSAVVGAVDADDAWSETFLSAMRAYPSLPADANIEAWLVTIAHRKAIDHRRRRRAVTLVADVPDRAGPSFAATDDELWDRVRELPTKQRTALALRYVADAAYGDIAEVMGTTEEAARRNVHEGLKRLRTEYQQ